MRWGVFISLFILMAYQPVNAQTIGSAACDAGVMTQIEYRAAASALRDMNVAKSVFTQAESVTSSDLSGIWQTAKCSNADIQKFATFENLVSGDLRSCGDSGINQDHITAINAQTSDTLNLMVATYASPGEKAFEQCAAPVSTGITDTAGNAEYVCPTTGCYYNGSHCVEIK